MGSQSLVIRSHLNLCKEEINKNTSIENIISTTKKICEEIGLKNEERLMNKCILTLIKKHKIFNN